ncbi:Retrovirus-related Pol polyprotein from transposon TNT [Fusarium oxysporum f. sp. cubense]|uniref:Retrovirus-related Pol polyprotein from transposon TNT n=1 Tax=Fusarium oxysporum f. sp. cubense TaxID=61366 RepID=A0A559LL75_FUSOC|nr:Retrovirus-related Pol polyprotein from transposon TNT [Fusarium oxysporum f. sp. cubense]TVY62482.1 Retrovirus-related Pol polyprotein from transposon TNT [Fusarium oxysporum f. sp. cubense]TVY62485.1 Retrovirus-related Pol polyprotein from transposon TNT [Fusarium oxysporum f. sp. cubense]TVY62537.1 Retrovirus-related Pol polyprotein from transposon TNT [Fusarium oxysporum f. sp. cubense]TVY62656.1 Retrovirus-related Pol polyprotein from transposon TNT [Fusarium oxysporum f. sp. cubense]
MTDLGPVKYFLGVRITRDRNSQLIYLSQGAYLTRTLEKFSLEECRPVNTPMERNALSTSLPRDDTDSASPNERKDDSSKTGSLMLAKRGLRYLQKTRDHGLVLGGVKKGQVDWKIDLRLASSTRRIYSLPESQKTGNCDPLYHRSRNTLLFLNTPEN